MGVAEVVTKEVNRISREDNYEADEIVENKFVLSNTPERPFTRLGDLVVCRCKCKCE